MNRTRRTLALGATVLMTGCASYFPAYEPSFQTSWTEETRLLDGRVIPVRVTRTYLRLDRNSKYRDAIRRTTEVSFDAGPGIGQFAFSVSGNIAMVDQKDGTWYFLVSSGFPPYQTRSDIAMGGLKPARLEGNQVVVIKSARDFPKEFVDLNLMHLTNVEILDQYSGKYLTLKDKEEFRRKNNTAMRDLKIFLTPCAKDGTC